MQVERAALEAVLGDAELTCARPQPGERDACGLLHHVAELAGEDERVAALHRCRLDEEDVPACAGDGQSGRDTRNRRPLRGLAEELLTSERIAHGGLVRVD